MPTRTQCALLAFGLLTAPALAQDASESAVESEASPPKTGFSLRFDTEWIGSADLDTGPGDVSVTRLGASFGIRHIVNPRLALRFGASVEHSQYDFSGATGLVAGTADPFDDITITTVSVGGEYASSETDAWIFGVFVRSAGESGADFGDTIDGGIMLGYRHTFSETFSLGAAVNVGTELEDDIYAIPIVIIDWQINDKWRLATTEQARVQLRYEHADAWAFGVEGGYERREFRLDQSGPLPHGVVDERRIPLAAFATYTASPNFIITGRIGTSVWSEFEFSNSRGNFVSEDELAASLALGLSLTVRF